MGPDYVALDGINSFTPTDVTSVPSTTYLVAASREDYDVEVDAPAFHYFVAGAAMYAGRIIRTSYIQHLYVVYTGVPVCISMYARGGAITRVKHKHIHQW